MSATTSNSSAPISEIIKDKLYLGGVFGLQDTNQIKELGIKYIINVASEYADQLLPSELKDIFCYKFPMIDDINYNIRKHCFDAVHLIDILLSSGGKVFVHCAQGISRSATIIILYLMKYHFMKYDKAYELVKDKRSIIHPNPRFITDLKAIEKELSCEQSSEKRVIVAETKPDTVQPKNITPSHQFLNEKTLVDDCAHAFLQSFPAQWDEFTIQSAKELAEWWYSEDVIYKAIQMLVDSKQITLKSVRASFRSGSSDTNEQKQP